MKKDKEIKEAIWDFGEYSTEDLQVILQHIKALDELGIQQDEDMLLELDNELRSRGEEASGHFEDVEGEPEGGGTHRDLYPEEREDESKGKGVKEEFEEDEGDDAGFDEINPFSLYEPEGKQSEEDRKRVTREIIWVLNNASARIKAIKGAEKYGVGDTVTDEAIMEVFYDIFHFEHTWESIVEKRKAPKKSNLTTTVLESLIPNENKQ